MQHKWFLTSDHCNFKINTDLLINNLMPGDYNPDNHMVCFSHVPKTAGTSIESILSKNFSASDSLHVNAPDLNDMPELLQLKKKLPKLISGHHPMHGLLYQLLADTPVFHFTLLRNPVDRVLSYYNYIKGKNDHPLHGSTKDATLIEFLTANLSPELNNGQAKRFSGYLHNGETDNDELLKIGKETLSRCFSLILTTCLFDEGLLLLKRRLKLKDIYYQRSNVSTPFITRKQLTESEMDLIQSMNQVDIELFDWAKTKCQNSILKELSEEEITDFQTQNKLWSKLINQ